MTNRTVVILTEPARCQLADADALVQAVLQAQQLNQAGLGASQAFCDHPAAAMRFIEAYARAYPELQLRSSDLPPPEHLYSIVADGRVMPLPGPAAPDSAKPGDAGQLYPLYVLSLGAPDTLMRALEHNRFARSDIQVVEIARPESPTADPMSVAEAVAHEPLSRASWRAEASAEPGRDRGDALPMEALSSNDPLKLASVEVDLDHIQVDRRGDQKVDFDPSPAEAVAAVAPPASVAVADSGGSKASVSGTGGGSATSSDAAAKSAPEAAPGGAALSAPAREPGSGSESSPAARATAPGDDQARSPEGDHGSDPPEDPAADEPDGTPPADPDGTATAPGDGEEESPEEEAGDADASEDSAAAADATEDGASATRAAGSGDEPPRIAAASFGVPGEDVRYPPNCSFAMDDDVAYAAPAGLGPDLGMFEDFFGGSGESEAVDLEAVLARLSDAAGASAAPVHDLDLRLRPGFDANPEPDGSRPPEPDGPLPDQQDAEHQRSPAVHDLDL